MQARACLSGLSATRRSLAATRSAQMTAAATQTTRLIHTHAAALAAYRSGAACWQHRHLVAAPRLQLPVLPVSRRFFSAGPAAAPHTDTNGADKRAETTSTNASASASDASTAVSPVSSSVSVPAAPLTWREKGADLWSRAKAEGRHYWLGTKLLWADLKIAVRLLNSIAHGHELTRRERRQLLRTSADLVRMVPFVVILLVPFAEFALPFILKIFPNMLPSTYLDATGADAKLQKQLLVKMEMARFLQETTHLLAQKLAQKKGISSEEAKAQAKNFRDFMEAVRTGKKVRNSDIVGFSKLFDSELTLENLTKDQLSAMCRMLDIRAFGSVWVLRFKLQEKLRQIQQDDVLIRNEGVDSLSEAELKQACIERGIYTGPEKDAAYLKRKLTDWLELSLLHQVPVTLLLLSRAFSRQMTGTSPGDAATKEESHDDLQTDLATTLAYVPHVVIAEAEKEIVDLTDDAAAKLKSIEDEAVEAAYEEIQARKDGRPDKATRANKALRVKTAVGVTAEKLEELTEKNVNVGSLLDGAEEQHAEQEQQDQAQQDSQAQAQVNTAATTAAAQTPSVPATAATPTPAVDATAPVVPSPPSDSAVVVASSSSSKKEKKDSKDKEKQKTIKVVDQLNDKVGAILEEIKAQTKVLDALQKEKAELEAKLTHTQQAAADGAAGANTAAAPTATATGATTVEKKDAKVAEM